MLIGRAGHACGVQRGGQLVAGALGELGAQQRVEQRMIADPRRVGGETLVLGPFRVAEDFGELGELAVVADRQRDKAVGARKDVLRLDIGMAVAAALRGVAGDQLVHRLVGQKRRLHVEHGEIDVVALPGLVAPRQRRQHADRGVHAGHQVDDRNADLLRPAAGHAVALAGDAHQAAHRLDHEIVGGRVALRPGLAEAGDRAIDDASD